MVLGSANMDLAAYTRVAPARGETVTGEAFRTVAGGKGANQAIAAARAGGEVTFVGAVGDDDFGPRLRAALDGAGVGTGPLRTVPGPSGIAHIVVDGEGHNAIVVVPGANGTVTSSPTATRTSSRRPVRCCSSSNCRWTACWRVRGPRTGTACGPSSRRRRPSRCPANSSR